MRGARAPLPGVAAGLGLLVIWLIGGAGLLDALRYLGYTAAFVLAPGCLLERLLRPDRRTALDRLATGWALGYAIELAVFALTAALGARTLLPWVVLAIAAVCGLLVWAGPGHPDIDPVRTRHSSAFGWVVAGLGILAVAYVAVAYFTSSPLPGTVSSVSYYADFPFHLGIAGEALHQWPIGDPKVAGTALPYHIFAYMHLASVAQITGLGLPLILLRLDIPMLVLAFVTTLAAAGRALTGRAAVGVLAVVLVLFVGELHPNPNAHFTFLNTFFYSEYTSPTFIFGLVLFVPALQALVELCTAPPGAPTSARRWALLVILLTACGGAKATILPVLLGGLVLALLVQAFLHRRVPRGAIVAAGVIAALALIFQLTLYAGFNGGLGFNPPGSVRATDVMALIRARIHSRLVATVFWILATPLAVIGFCVAPMIGLVGVALRPIRSWPERQVLLLCLLLASFVPFLAFAQFGSSENFFTYYGYVAGGLLSAEGLVVLWRRWAGRPSRARLLGGAVLAVIGLAATVGVIYAIRGAIASPLGRYAAWFGVLLAVLVVAGVLTRRRPRRARGPAGIAIVVGIMLFGALEAPLEVVPGLASALAAGRPLYDAHGGLLTRGLYRGLVWVQTHTSPTAVLAVNNQYVGSSPGYMYYSAFTERRIFLEGWAYTARASQIGAQRVTFDDVAAFPHRLALNRAVFERGNRRALATLVHGYGVRYLLVDHLHGTASPSVAKLGRKVYSSSSLTVYRVG